MATIGIYFNNKVYKPIKIENVIMQEVIGNELIVMFKMESYDYNYTEVKKYPISSIDHFIVRMG